VSAQPREDGVLDLPVPVPVPASGSAASHDLVVVGSSAGGVEALRQLVSELPADLPACVLIVLHLPKIGGSSMLPDILARRSALPVRAARDGDPLVPGTVLVAPPDKHLIVDDGHVVLASGPLENGCRPAVDPLFRSAAHSHRGRVVGVVLTGNLDDGSAGLLSVARHGGETVVQDPADAMFPGMPSNALAAVPQARVVALDGVAALVAELVRSPAPAAVPLTPELEAQEQVEIELSRGRTAGPHTELHPGVPSAWSCPDCSGVLWELQDGPLLRFRCRTGHAWSLESLVHEQDTGVDTALWIALRALEERHALSVRVAESAERSGRTWSAQHFRDRAEEALGHAELLRRLLVGGSAGGAPRAARPAAEQR
jgi:two-component system chemotaxis response regulator CheB